MTSSIANRAHNEFLEWILEGGLLSAIGLLFAGFWILDGVYRLWFQSLQADSRLDLLIMRSALFVPVLVLIHSSVDYPMRTLSMACIIAVSCAMTISPLGTSPQFQRGAPPIKYV